MNSHSLQGKPPPLRSNACLRISASECLPNTPCLNRRCFPSSTALVNVAGQSGQVNNAGLVVCVASVVGSSFGLVSTTASMRRAFFDCACRWDFDVPSTPCARLRCMAKSAFVPNLSPHSGHLGFALVIHSPDGFRPLARTETSDGYNRIISGGQVPVFTAAANSIAPAVRRCPERPRTGAQFAHR